MRFAIIGRTETLYQTALNLRNEGHELGLIVTAKEAPEYTKTSSDFEVLAGSLGIPFFHTVRIEETAGFIRSLPPMDIGISMNYSGIIPQSVIDLFRLGILNAHSGDLPRYRGNACQAWAIINGEDQVGLCIHRMIGGELDSGDIITRSYFPLWQDTKITAVYQWMDESIPGMFSEAVALLGKDPHYILERQSPDPRDVLRCYPRKPEDGRIDWKNSAEQILRLVNACNRPYQGAFCEFGDRKVIIWDAQIAPEENFLAIPGQVTLIGEDFVDVATGSGKLRIREIETTDGPIKPSALCTSLRQRFI